MASWCKWTVVDYREVCNCVEFVQDLLNLCNETLAKEDENAQWKIFEEFLVKYPQNNTLQRTDDKFSSITQSCSLEVCSILLHKIPEMRGLNIALAYWIVDLLTDLYSKKCAHNLISKLENVTMRFSTETLTLRILSAFSHKSDFMKVLLNFNYISSLSEVSPHLTLQIDQRICKFMSTISGGLDVTSSVENQVREMIENTILKKETSWKRVFFVTVALRAIELKLQKNQHFAEEGIQCVRMYFVATTDPFLTVFEVRRILYACFAPLNKLNLTDTYSEEFKMLMPECPNTLQPRKLADLARFQVRQILKFQNLPLPAALEKINLPTKLKSFVLGESLHTTRYTGNNFSQHAVTKSELSSLFSDE